MIRKQKKVNRGLDLVVMRNEFYRDNYYRILTCVLLMLIINVCLATVVYYKWANPPQPQYFAATADGRIIKIHKLTDPTLPDDMVLQWTANAIHKTFSLDYIHWRTQLRDASDNFTPEGWRYFSSILKSTNDLKTLVDGKMVSNTEITGAPQIVRESIVDGHYAWNIKLPLLVTFTSKSNTIHIPINMTVIVIRVPVQYYKDKIAINNIFSQTVSASAYGN